MPAADASGSGSSYPYGFQELTQHEPFNVGRPARDPLEVIVIPRRPVDHSRSQSDPDKEMRGTMIARLPPACARRVKIVSLPAVKAFVDQEGYRMRKRMTIHDIIRFRKEGAVPIVMIGYENCLFSTNMRTGEHGAVYTVPERVAQLMEMPKFHLLVRRGPNTRWRFGTEEKPEEDVWYMGVYCAQNPHASLSEEGWRHLDDREQADVIRFQHHLHPDVPTDIISDYAAGYCKPSLMILENKDYDWQFVDRLVRVGAQVLQPAVPVNPRPRVDFRALRQQMLNASG